MHRSTLEGDLEIEGNDEKYKENHQCLDHISTTLVCVEDTKISEADAKLRQCKSWKEDDLGGVGVLLRRDRGLGIFHRRGSGMTSSTVVNLTVLADTIPCTKDL